MRRRRRLKDLDQLRQDIARMEAIAVRQLETALEAFRSSDSALAESVIEKDDLMDNLNLRVESRAFEMAARLELSDGEYRAARSALKVAVNLERSGDAAAHIARHIRIMRLEELEPRDYQFGSLAELAPRSVQEAVKAYLREDLTLAKRVCQREPELDRLYVEGLSTLSAAMEGEPQAIPYYLHVLAVLKYLEKIGDYVLNIGEQAVYLITGRRLKFSQFQQLDYLLGQDSGRFGFAPYLDGISGAIVAKVGSGIPLLYKEGSQRKIEEEVTKSATWRSIDANLTPKVLSVVSFRDRQALLREFADGALLSHLYFEQADPELQASVTKRLLQTLYHLWTRTGQPQMPDLDYVQQIQDRLPEVFSFHPNLRRLASSRLRYRGSVCLPLRQQIERLLPLEPGLAPPFSVWLHGDLNPNNIVYNPRDESLKFIDVHRSRLGDYLQDVTVFLVGLKREPDLSPALRRHLRQVESLVMDSIRRFAAEFGDATWENRLFLGLGRSYITSASSRSLRIASRNALACVALNGRTSS